MLLYILYKATISIKNFSPYDLQTLARNKHMTPSLMVRGLVIDTQIRSSGGWMGP